METSGSGTGEAVDEEDNSEKGFTIALPLSLLIWAIIGVVAYLIFR